MTTAYALVAPLRLGEDAQRLVRSLGIGRPDLKVGRREGHILIPLQRPIDPPIPGTSVEVAEFTSTKPPRSYRDVAQVPEKYRDQLPTSFDIVGDLVLIKIPEAIRVFGPAVGQAILKVHKNVKGVFHDDGVQGPFRVRKLTPLAGETRTRTGHTEFATRIEVDVSKAYFSPRLANEHDRVAKSVRAGEVVVDATAGVGPFTLLIGRQRRAAKIHAVDLNPDAVALLRENVKAHRLEDVVEVHEADAVEALGRLPPADRYIVNLPHGGEEILVAAARAGKPGALLHYYRVWPEATRPEATLAVVNRIREEARREAGLLEAHVVHAYSPQDRLYAADLRLA